VTLFCIKVRRGNVHHLAFQFLVVRLQELVDAGNFGRLPFDLPGPKQHFFLQFPVQAFQFPVELFLEEFPFLQPFDHLLLGHFPVAFDRPEAVGQGNRKAQQFGHASRVEVKLRSQQEDVDHVQRVDEGSP
jgi:hypothetical protein